MTLAAYLEALSAETPTFVDGARVLEPGDPLDALLAEIDSTVLPATLTFHNDAGSLALLATGRRLHMITAGGPKAVLNQPLDPDDTALTKAAAKALAAFAADAGTLRVAHGPVAGDDINMSDRVSVAQLNAALGRIVDDPNAPPVERFVTRMGDGFDATIRLSNRVSTDMTGATATLAQLRIVLSTQLSAFMDARAAACASHSTPSLTLLGDVLEDGRSIGLADFGQEAILFCLSTGELPIAIQAFYRAV